MHFYRSTFFALSSTLLLKVATVIPALILADIIDNLSTPSSLSHALLGAFACVIIVQALLTPLHA